MEEIEIKKIGLPEVLKPYKEYIWILLERDKEKIRKNIEDQKKDIQEEAQKRGYTTKLEYSLQIKIISETPCLVIIGKETETKAGNTFYRDVPLYRIPYDYFHLPTHRIKWKGWDKETQLKIDAVREKIENRIKIIRMIEKEVDAVREKIENRIKIIRMIERIRQLEKENKELVQKMKGGNKNEISV